MGTMTCYLDAVGVVAPGIANWPSLVDILRGVCKHEPAPLARYAPRSLPANERRRASQLVRLAFSSVEQIQDRLPAEGYASVFASSGGDYDIFHKICWALAQAEKIVSPTQFHNSVHNAPAGYWSIATQNTHPSTTISAHDFSFAMGLMDAVCQLQDEAQQVLLACYDMVPPPPIDRVRRVTGDFSASLLLSAEASTGSLCRLSIDCLAEHAETAALAVETLEQLREGNAAAHSLSLLAAVARGEETVTDIALHNGGCLRIAVEPISC